MAPNCRRNSVVVQFKLHHYQKFPEFGMIVRPTPRAYFVPELRLFRTGNAYRDVGGMLRDASFNRAVENVADLLWRVPASAKQAQGGNADQRTHFMKHRRSTCRA